jgi:tetratricopeptide (TPR) repeat protein
MDRTTFPFLGLVVSLAALGPSRAAAQATVPAAPNPVEEGIAAFNARDPVAALRFFEEALAADSTSYEANWRAALTLITLGAQTPDSVKSPGRDSLYAQAARYARRAVQADSNGADGQFVLANALGRTALTKSKDERIRLASEIRNAALRAIEINPRHDGAYHVLGRWNEEIMRLSGLSRFFARNLMGAHVFGQASWENAIANMQRAVELDPRRIVHRLDLARIYVERKRWSDARAQLDTLEALPERDFLDPQYKETGAVMLQRIAGKGGDAKRANS